MFDRLLNILRKALITAESNAIDNKFEKFDNKFEKFDNKMERFDERMDSIERSQAEQNQKLSAINEVCLANNEALEQKLNSNKATSEAIRTVMDVQNKSFNDTLKRLETLVLQAIRRE